MTYLIRRGDKFLHKNKKDFVTVMELREAYGCESHVTGTELIRKLESSMYPEVRSNELKLTPSYDVLVEWLDSGLSDKVQILRGGLTEQRRKIEEQRNEIAQLKNKLDKIRESC